LFRLDCEDYIVGGNVETQIIWTKTGLLFFLFGSNEGNEEIRREKVYLKACKENHIDGINLSLKLSVCIAFISMELLRI
jgi:hypothetical protein